MFRILRIRGESMLPVYQPGDFVILWRGFFMKVKPGDVIVFKLPFYDLLIKEVKEVSSAGIYVLGTGENSLDSRRLGLIPREALQGKALWHIRR